MKGVILAGGKGTRLHPLTKITNKHLLPVYDKPMIYYPLETLVRAGIRDVLLVTGGNNAGDFMRLLGNGRDFGLKMLQFAYQEGERGIADALSLAEHFVEDDRVVVILGDNLIEDDLTPEVEAFRTQPSGARILLKEVDRPQDYGVAEIVDGRITSLIEKPEQPVSRLAVIGVYMFDSTVFDIIRTLTPSERDELEITDVNRAYLERGELTHGILSGWWADAGASIDGLLAANQLAASRRAR